VPLHPIRGYVRPSGFGSSYRRAGVIRRVPSEILAKWSGVVWLSALRGRTVLYSTLRFDRRLAANADKPIFVRALVTGVSR
jgi:hypothetical protein